MQIEHRCRDYLIDVATAYGKAHKLALTTVSRRFHGREYFLGDFEQGNCTVTLRKFDEMIAEFRAQWPKGIRWPASDIHAPNKNVVKKRAKAV